MLDSKRLAELYSIFRNKLIWKGWHLSYLNEIEYFKGLSDADLSSPANQERLWRARGVSTLGPGESVNIRGAYTDADIVNLFLQVRNFSPPEDIQKRATSVADFATKIISIILQRHSSQRPLAKLRRALTILLPNDMHTCYQLKAKKHLHTLLFGNDNHGFSDGAVHVRDQIRKAVGAEASLEESVWRSMFCWWLHENYSAISQGDYSSLGNTSGEFSGEEDVSKALLDIWPPTKQRKGLTAVSKYLEAYRMVVTAARGGASPDDIVTTIKTYPDLANYAPSSCRQLFNLVRTFGFIENKDGLWYPSVEGEELVEDDPPDVLVEKLLVQVFGFGHLLLYVEKHTNVSRRTLFDYLKDVYAAWTSDFMPSALLAWLKSLGMIDFDSASFITLTDYGRDWVKRLPSELPAPEINVEPDKFSPISEHTGVFAGLSAAQVCAAFTADSEMQTFVFDQDQIENLHFAWHCSPKKRFVIFSGLSGTGKTALLLQYARLYCKTLDIPPERHVAIIPVSPDWRDPSGLFGYFNALHADPTFQAEPGLRLILDAAQNPQFPFFLLLDEMNLARVERYFAPFLSSMESGHPLLLHAHEEAVNDVPPTVPWPKNLFIGGTVNMDETTHAFSDKVLDRAFTMEFWKVDLPEFFDRRVKAGQPSFPSVETVMVKVNQSLFKIRRHFGYRTAREILDFLEAAGAVATGDNLWRLADQAFFSKILPRLRGEQTPAMNLVLQELQSTFAENNMERCQIKLHSMKESLTATGVTRFWA